VSSASENARWVGRPRGVDLELLGSKLRHRTHRPTTRACSLAVVHISSFVFIKTIFATISMSFLSTHYKDLCKAVPLLCCLDIDVTKIAIVPSNRIHHIPCLGFWGRPLQIDSVSLARISRENIHSVFGVLHLPNPPDSIYHTMMEVEDGVTWRRVEVLQLRKLLSASRVIMMRNGFPKKKQQVETLTPPGSPPMV
jgi:hypothetical protein